MFVHLAAMSMKESPGCLHKQGGRDGEDDDDDYDGGDGDDDIMHLTTMSMQKSPGRSHKQGGRDYQERQGGGHQCHQAGNLFELVKTYLALFFP